CSPSPPGQRGLYRGLERLRRLLVAPLPGLGGGELSLRLLLRPGRSVPIGWPAHPPRPRLPPRHTATSLCGGGCNARTSVSTVRIAASSSPFCRANRSARSSDASAAACQRAVVVLAWSTRAFATERGTSRPVASNSTNRMTTPTAPSCAHAESNSGTTVTVP